MTLTAADNSPVPQTPRMDANGWVFSGLATGVTYELEVKVDGYQPAREMVMVPAMDYGSAAVTVFLKPKDEQLALHPPAGAFVLAPRAQKEVQKGLRDMDAGKISSAQKHFQNAVHMAPGNPYVNYVMGMSYLLAKQLPTAQPYLEESVSVDPKQVPSLLALGTLRFEEANYPGAIDVLNKAVQLDPSSWKSQWMLSASYLHQHDYQQAREHAEKALATGKDAASQVELILGEALAGLGERQRAIEALKAFLTDYPKDPSAPKIRAWVEDLRKDP
ncbi:MAG: tetratricopeptide repeat protein [Candidatus Dormibacteria bacterium]